MEVVDAAQAKPRCVTDQILSYPPLALRMLGFAAKPHALDLAAPIVFRG
jgi:hypothetical protein